LHTSSVLCAVPVAPSQNDTKLTKICREG